MALVTSYDQAKIDELLADLQAWASANLAPITEPIAVAAQAAADAAQADVDSLTTTVAANDAAAVHLTGTETVAGVKTFSDKVVISGGMSETTAIVNGATYTASLTDRTIICNVACTVTLPNNAGGLYRGKRYKIINNSSGMVTISTTANVNNAVKTIPAENVINLWSDDTSYYNEDPYGTIVCTSSTKPTSNLYAGLTIFETDKNRTCVYNGSSWYVTEHNVWVAWTPTPTLITSFGGSFKYKFTAYRLEIMGYFNAGSTSGAGQPTLTIPSGLTFTTSGVQREQYFPGPGVNTIAILTGNTNSITMNLTAGPNGANFASGSDLSSTRMTGCTFEVQEAYF